MRKIHVIIGAAGSGKRMGAPVPKQFLKQGGRTILEQTVQKFVDCDFVENIVIVAGEDYLETCGHLCERQAPQGRIHVTAGGKERQDSVCRAMAFLEKKGVGAEDIVLVHDGVRPYVSKEIIRTVAAAAEEKGAAIAAVPPKDTIRHVEGSKEFLVHVSRADYETVIQEKKSIISPRRKFIIWKQRVAIHTYI